MKRATHLCLLTLAAVTLAGCLGAIPYTPIQRYGIVPEIDPVQRETAAGSIAIRPLEYAEPYTTTMVYRPDQYTVAYRDAEDWAEPPRDSVTRALLDSLAATNYFSDVGTASDVPLPRYILTGQVRRFDEMRTTQPPHALLEVRINVRENGRPGRAVMSQTYRETVSMNDTSAGALAEAMTEAVSIVVANATEDIVSAVEALPDVE